MKYSTYFSNRGVDPCVYTNFQLPFYIENSLGTDKSIDILDIGCGYGQMIMALNKKGYLSVDGIDIADEAIEYLHKKGMGGGVKKSSIIDYKEKKYDFIMMSHVLEHIVKEEIISTLEHIRENLLKEGGKLCILVPNAQANTDCYWAYEDYTHNLLFTAGSLYFVLKEAGFSNVEFLDPKGLGGTKGLKLFIKQMLLNLYIFNKLFWNKVTGSAYHQPSPMIFTWELKCLASR